MFYSAALCLIKEKINAKWKEKKNFFDLWEYKKLNATSSKTLTLYLYNLISKKKNPTQILQKKNVFKPSKIQNQQIKVPLYFASSTLPLLGQMPPTPPILHLLWLTRDTLLYRVFANYRDY